MRIADPDQIKVTAECMSSSLYGHAQGTERRRMRDNTMAIVFYYTDFDDLHNGYNWEAFTNRIKAGQDSDNWLPDLSLLLKSNDFLDPVFVLSECCELEEQTGRAVVYEICFNQHITLTDEICKKIWEGYNKIWDGSEVIPVRINSIQRLNEFDFYTYDTKYVMSGQEFKVYSKEEWEQIRDSGERN